MSLLSARPLLSDPIQSALYEILCMDNMGIDGLAEKLQFDTLPLINALAMMEIEGLVTSSGGLYRVV